MPAAVVVPAVAAATPTIPQPPPSTALLATPEGFDLTQGARQLLMDALAARQPVVRLNPLIDWLHKLEQGDTA